ncbi:LysE family translocator [Oceaniovalibus sp. ACAM 378]|uniref:LysE family translocator n=1 Tax=Oceaniovalibus sp. ACAM 378 TaxID=2599923 RepID=UPI0011D34752|nr:LysE family translocator [Oceaniovalibus sp. ACAM 378]TYB89237.1 LysE family translocator [Oceaniovalibus sp. ACAM 378]
MLPVDPVVLLAFLPASLALNLTPGADMMFCLGQGLRAGWRPAVAASAGIALGGMVHVALAGLGLGAVVAAAPWVFEAIRWVGVLYLLWLAVATLRAKTRADVPVVRSRRALRDGLVVNLSNPKVILFVLAFVPQFVDVTRPVLGQFLYLGAVLALGGFVINAMVGIFAGGVARRLMTSSGSAHILTRIMSWVSAGIFGALALRLAVMEKG